MIEYAQRLTHRQRNVLAGDTHPSVGARLFSGALAGGAQALGVETGIAVGAPADLVALDVDDPALVGRSGDARSEEHTSELQSLMRNSYAVFCLKKKTNKKK